MKIGKTIQCQSCGGSRVIKHADKSMLECQYCGAMMTYTESARHQLSDQSQSKSSKKWVLILTISALVVLLLVFVMMGYFSIRQPDAVVIIESEKPALVEANTSSNTLAFSQQQNIAHT